MWWFWYSVSEVPFYSILLGFRFTLICHWSHKWKPRSDLVPRTLALLLKRPPCCFVTTSVSRDGLEVPWCRQFLPTLMSLYIAHNLSSINICLIKQYTRTPFGNSLIQLHFTKQELIQDDSRKNYTLTDLGEERNWIFLTYSLTSFPLFSSCRAMFLSKEKLM